MKRRQTQEQLILFTRYPQPGTTKTRLAAALGETGAAAMQKKLTEHTLLQIMHLQQLRPVAVCICFEGGSWKRMEKWLGPGYNYREQSGGDLGQRMAAAFATAFREEYKRIVIVGTDCPGLNGGHIAQAFEALQHKDLVLGPAEDGGYYLIGLNHEEISLFADVAWGTDAVLAQTVNIAAQKGLTLDLLETLRDVDRPEDLAHLQRPAPGSNGYIPPGTSASNEYKHSCSCSVIIPVRNEAENLAAILPELLAIPGIEVLVADGGSSDNTVAVAESLGAIVLSGSPCRAMQMNNGARAARSDVLLFLHGDTRLEQGFVGRIREVLQQKGVAAGAFRLKIDGRGYGLRIIEWLANLRSRLWQMPYGDQGIFVRADVFFSVGGFPSLPIMEDFELIRRLKHKGRIRILPLAAVTSPRRWMKLGIIRTTIINQAIIAGYLLGARRLGGN